MSLIVAVAMMLTGCIYDRMDCPENEELENVGEVITIEFTMLTRNAQSASRSLDPPPSPETGFSAENYLDLGNLTFLLFDDNRKMLRTFSPDVDVIEEATGPYVKYRVRTFLHDNYFLKTTSENITFTIVVLGNFAGLSPERFNFSAGEKLEDIFKPEIVGTFAMPLSNNSANTWIPAVAPIASQNSGHIPMSGMQTFTVPTGALRASSPDSPYQLSEGPSQKHINMLRALAKIEIVDKIAYSATDNNHFTIEHVELIGHNTRGSILPLFGEWERDLETQYVKLPSVPSDAAYIGSDPGSGIGTSVTGSQAERDFFLDADATAARTDGCKVYSCYLTEYDPEAVGSASPMWMRLTMSAPWGEDETTQFRLDVAPYTDGTPQEPMPILRNNIYRYVITGAKEIDLDVQPFSNLSLSFGFGLRRDARGDLMVLPDENGDYPEYFLNFAKTHSYPQAIDDDGNETGELIRLEDGDYYAIVVGENNEMSDAVIWVKDRDACHVLSNFGPEHDGQDCSARRVESFYGNNQAETFLKDIFGYRRVYHFINHNSIVRHPQDDNLLFCYIENFGSENVKRKYYEIESWDDASKTGWIVNKNEDGTEVGFQEITSDGNLGNAIPIE
ncbi:MAG: hypothetical protein K2M07_02885 [Muribaculaceae bacterium]|nr:hypothetical protein [Muribaculaceae bacterium]